MHPGMTLQQLSDKLTVVAEPNTQLVDIHVQESDPHLAAQLANQIGQSFVQYSGTHFPGKVLLLPAQVPIVPMKPRPLLDTALGALAGLGLAIGLIYLFEWMDNRPRSPEEVQQVMNMEVLAVIPYISRRKSRKASVVVEQSDLVQSYRTLCAILNAEQAKCPFKLLLVTSPGGGDGKSKITANMASSLARTGKRVLLVDADLHRPVQAQQFQLNNRRGLSAIFIDPSGRARALLNGQETSIPTLRVLTAGVLPPHPAELLQSSVGKRLFGYFSEEAPFDYVVFDAPPLLGFADAQTLASLVHATILVADVDKTSRRVLLQAKRILERANTRVLGVIINKCRWPENRKPVGTYYYAKHKRQPEVDTSLVMYPGPSLSDRPSGTPASTFVESSSSTDGEDSSVLKRSPPIL
jgi:capsular exopolysaccharide synthesis family protein